MDSVLADSCYVYSWYLSWRPHSSNRRTSSDGGPYRCQANAEAAMASAKAQIEQDKGIVLTTSVSSCSAPMTQVVVEDIKGITCRL